MILLIKLLLAHIIGDFILQPKKWVKDKEKHKLKSRYLYLHIAIHLTLLFLITWDLTLWLLLLSIAFSHGIIDALKLSFQKKKNKRKWFFMDQLLHITVIVVGFIIVKPEILKSSLLTEVIGSSSLLILTCLIFLTQPVSIIMQVIFSKWDIPKLTKDNESLQDAGKYIGILERLLVFVFIITDHWEAVGFLITAKSVFRFGDLKESKERKLTEYILIGTLISFGIAILIGLFFKFMLPFVLS
ncbi:DUF3307 domain-containing protein [Mangrovimonas sp. ST2L15]|uniref:DUF3307 domain-containing protein n=1 Tax=Mangrovimonas sp. ST2L15 TaxID=1645916 RepID=UPI0006B6833B|nr:DUF3307 domain-containing protein [Mangrovimonas sp. ST2L15]